MEIECSSEGEKFVLTLNEKNFEKFKPRMKEIAKKETLYDSLATDDCILKQKSIQIEDNKIKVWASFINYGEIQDTVEELRLGQFHVVFELSLDDISKLINYYTKRLNKLKTVLEAVK